MRTKDMDEVLPNITVDVNSEIIEIDGAKTNFINGAISQNALELRIRMIRAAKSLMDGVKLIDKKVHAALSTKTPVQDGNRTATIEEVQANLSYKDLYTDELKKKDWSKAKIKAKCESLGYKSQLEGVLRKADLSEEDIEKWMEDEKEKLDKKEKLVFG